VFSDLLYVRCWLCDKEWPADDSRVIIYDGGRHEARCTDLAACVKRLQGGEPDAGT
jgi:hypothetical protein